MPRPKDTPNTAQMLRVARLFYKDEKTRQEIAKLENIDSRKVNWLLQQAKELELVKITFHETTESDLEHQILKRFPHLQRVLIVPGPSIAAAEPEKWPQQYEELLRRFGIVAADYFVDLLTRQNPDKPFRVGVSGGESVLEFVNAVPEQKRENVRICATAVVGHGQSAMSASHIDPSTNATILWAKSGRVPDHCQALSITPYDTDKRGPEARKFIKEQLRQLARNAKVKAVIEGMQNLDVVFTGIGTLMPPPEADAAFKNRLTMISVLHPLVTLKELAREKAVGDISYCLIDADGNSKEEWRFFPTVGDYAEDKGVEFYRRMVEQKKIVAAIAGPFKLAPIKAVLKGKLINVLVTDEATARQIAEGD